jgi:hypothetical protein
LFVILGFEKVLTKLFGQNRFVKSAPGSHLNEGGKNLRVRATSKLASSVIDCLLIKPLVMPLSCRVARWYIFRPKIPIWENFRESSNGRYWYSLCPFGFLLPFVIFYCHLVYFEAFWCILLPFGIISDHLVHFVIWYVVERKIWQPCSPACRQNFPTFFSQLLGGEKRKRKRRKSWHNFHQETEFVFCMTCQHYRCT